MFAVCKITSTSSDNVSRKNQTDQIVHHLLPRIILMKAMCVQIKTDLERVKDWFSIMHQDALLTSYTAAFCIMFQIERL